MREGRHEFLYDRAISTYFDLQAGVRADLNSSPGRTWAALGIHGLAVCWFDLEATAYASDSGHFAARLAGSYDLLITQRLVLQPQIELSLYSNDARRRGVGSGLSRLDTGLRLRYEITRKFAPYIGVADEQRFGPSASFARREGEPVHDLRFVFGARIWFQAGAVRGGRTDPPDGVRQVAPWRGATSSSRAAPPHVAPRGRGGSLRAAPSAGAASWR